MTIVEYKDESVLVAARKRISLVFDEFDRVVVSVSAGKDSTVIRHLCIEEAERRGRRVSLFFLDQEAEYRSTIELMAEWMSDGRIDPLWFQVPMKMTNATSHVDYYLETWEPGANWIHGKNSIAIHEIDGEYPDRFYDFFDWYEQQSKEKTAFVVGLRSKESFNRFRAVTKKPGYNGWGWSTKTKSKNAFRIYPIYDWTFGDIWKYINDNRLRYNLHYDRMFAKYGINMRKMRVSNLVHEKSFRCLVDLQEFEPDTYERLVKRIGGVHCAALYASEGSVLNAKDLPASFSSWRDYRDYLLETTPIDKIERFRKRFSSQSVDENTFKQQVKQILVNDWENSIPVTSPRGAAKKKMMERWWDEL